MIGPVKNKFKEKVGDLFDEVDENGGRSSCGVLHEVMRPPACRGKKPVLTQGGETLHGGKSNHPSVELSNIPIWRLFAFSMLGIELFDVASKVSTLHRTFRRHIELFDVTSSKCSMLDIEK